MTGGRVGMVLSGGGAYGAYEVGVIKALMTGAAPSTGYQPIDPHILTGTSVGAYNAAVLASQPGVPPAAAAAYLEEMWTQRVADTFTNCGNGVYRIRGVPFQFFDPGCYRHPVQALLQFGKDAATLGALGVVQGVRFLNSDASIEARTMGLLDLEALLSESPLKALLDETIDLESLRRSTKELSVVASNWKRGVPRIFSREEITDTVGVAAILASTAIPIIFPPVAIGEDLFVDGGVLMNTPLKPALRAGAKTLHVVFADPLLRKIPFQPVPSTLDTAYRLFAILAAVQLRNDIAKANSINLTLELFERQGGGGLSRPEEKLFFEFGRRFLERRLSGRPYEKVAVHTYRPVSDLGGGEGLLDFSQRKIEELIAVGFQETVDHDCAKAGCSLPGGEA